MEHGRRAMTLRLIGTPEKTALLVSLTISKSSIRSMSVKSAWVTK